MNNNLEIIRINREELSEENYFESLLAAAQAKLLLDDESVKRIQYECLNLLAYKTERYNAGDSTSIRIEKAQEILESIYFTLGIALKTYENPSDALAAMQKQGVKDTYIKGRRRIDVLLAATKTVHSKLMANLIKTPNVFYGSTLADAVNGFFKLYYPDYFAAEIHITADYPLYNPRPRLLGIEFIKAYVQAAYYENEFCTYFGAFKINCLLLGYSKYYSELLINIYEFVLAAAIACVIVKKDVSKLSLTLQEAAFLQAAFKGRNEDEILSVIIAACGKLNRNYSFSKGLWQYVQGSLATLANKIMVLSQHHNLHQIIYGIEQMVSTQDEMHRICE